MTKAEFGKQLHFIKEDGSGKVRFEIPQVIDSMLSGEVETRPPSEKESVYSTGLFADARTGEFFRYKKGTFQESKESIQPASNLIIVTSNKIDPDGDNFNHFLGKVSQNLSDRAGVYIFDERNPKKKGTNVINGLINNHIINIQVYLVGYYFYLPVCTNRKNKRYMTFVIMHQSKPEKGQQRQE